MQSEIISMQFTRIQVIFVSKSISLSFSGKQIRYGVQN